MSTHSTDTLAANAANSRHDSSGRTKDLGLAGEKLVAINGEPVGPWGIEASHATNIDGLGWEVTLEVWIGAGETKWMVGLTFAPNMKQTIALDD